MSEASEFDSIINRSLWDTPNPIRSPLIVDNGLSKPILSIPPELLLEIFSYLDYTSLINIEHTCRLFHDIIKENPGRLAVQLFRYKVSDLNYPLDTGMDETEYCFAFHPALHKLSGCFPLYHARNMTIDDIGFKDKRAPGGLRDCVEMKFMKEIAFAPGVPLQEIMKQNVSKAGALYLLSKGPNIPNMTVQQFIVTLLDILRSLSALYIDVWAIRGSRGVLNFLKGFMKIFPLLSTRIHANRYRSICFRVCDVSPISDSSFLVYMKDNVNFEISCI